MKTNLGQYIKPLRKILFNEEGKDKDTLMEEYFDIVDDIQNDSEMLLIYDDPDFDEVATLQRKIKRNLTTDNNLFSRDPESQLFFRKDSYGAIPFNLCPYDDADEASIYKPITEFINQNFKASNSLNKADLPFLTGNPTHQISEEQMQTFAQLLTEATHKAAKHISNHATALWAWEKDIEAYAIYTFERFYELAYKMFIEGEDVKSVDYNPLEIYTYRVPDVPAEVESYMLKKETKLIDIIDSIKDMVEQRLFHTCHTPLWIHTILFQMGLGAFRVIGESKEF